MATVYGNKVSSVWRSYLTYTITDNPTSVTIALEGGLNIPDEGYTSKRIFTSNLYRGATQEATGTYNGSLATLVGVLTQPIATKTLTINKTSSAQSITFKNTLKGSGTSTSSTASYTLQIAGITTYQVTYYANGGSGTVPSTYTTKVAGTALTLPNAAQSGLTRTGYTLVSWNTKADGSGTSYSLGGTIPANVNQVIDLYAIWRQNYVAPTITNVEVFRTTSGGTTQVDDGTYVYVKFNYTNGVVSGTSTLPSCTIKIGSSTYTPTLSGGSFTNRYGTFSSNNTYQVTITLSNTGYESSATVYTTSVSTATYPMDILGTGQAMGLMHAAVSGQKVTLSDTYIDGNLHVGGAIYSAIRDTIAKSSSKSFTLESNHFYHMITANVPASLKGDYIIGVSSAGTVGVAAVRSATDISYTATANTLNVSNANASYAVVVRIEEI